MFLRAILSSLFVLSISSHAITLDDFSTRLVETHPYFVQLSLSEKTSLINQKSLSTNDDWNINAGISETYTGGSDVVSRAYNDLFSTKYEIGATRKVRLVRYEPIDPGMQHLIEAAALHAEFRRDFPGSKVRSFFEQADHGLGAGQALLDVLFVVHVFLEQPAGLRGAGVQALLEHASQQLCEALVGGFLRIGCAHA